MSSRYRTVLARMTHFGTVLVVFTISGCGDSTTDKGQVKGKVILNGQPVKGGTIVLAPLAASGETASGEVQQDGTFTLTTAEPEDGAPIGKNRVSYKPPVTATEPPENWDSSKGDPPREKSPYERLVPKEGEIEVKPDGNDITVELVPDTQTGA
jgi:hypothetical protein